MSRVDRIQAHVTVYVEFEGSRIIKLDYIPEDGDPLARALLDKAAAINRMLAEGEAAAGRALDTGGIV